MQNKLAFECLDRTLRDIMKSVSPDRYNKLFGGVTVLLGGDFRQILPVIRKGSRAEIVAASISRSYLWSECRLFVLQENMRLRRGKNAAEQRRIKEFTNWVLDVGDGIIPHLDGGFSEDNTGNVQIPSEYCIQSESSDVNVLIDMVFPDLHERFTDVDYLRERAILTPTNKVVDHLNNLIFDKIGGESHLYQSADSVQCPVGCHENLTSAFPVEYLNSFKLPGMPPHKLILKEGVVVMLLRNLNQTVGLCNGTRLIVRKCLKHTLYVAVSRVTSPEGLICFIEKPEGGTGSLTMVENIQPLQIVNTPRGTVRLIKMIVGDGLYVFLPCSCLLCSICFVLLQK
ncbi:hypothetical protein DCAR_0101230 [Daucus carota subsp. sativus]|uniref:ATP-dependent DNA helicase n=1 Tax=Daucus carota subsp. sativus TaxID=79200 RepID=A0AAF0W2D0_DAUCS|nr:hypothetical protein DCAR_0101230 [Daucus carota subsp. sativus]